MDPSLLKQIDPKDFYEAHLRVGLRPDSRKLHKSRKCAISINEAENSCMVRLGDTSVMCKLADGQGIEGFSGLNFLEPAPCKVKVSVLADDGNLLEAVCICYQILVGTEDFLFPFTYCEVFKHYLRDPSKEEENLADAGFTVLVNSQNFNLIKTSGSSVALSDVEKIVLSLDKSINKARRNLERLRVNKSFIGKLY